MDLMIAGLLLALFAGLSTTIGGLLVFLIKDFKKCYLSFSLAFATGIMITVSFIELLPAGIAALNYTAALAVFFAGAAIAFLIDNFIPHNYAMEKSSDKKQDLKLYRLGLLVALGIAIHNFPEGFAVFAGSLSSLKLGIIVAAAIAMHNIPEGFAVAMPIYYSTKSKSKAFFAAFFSGIAEPIGALIAALVLLPFLSVQLVGASLALVAGIMVYICIDELLPTAYSCADGKQHLMTFAFLLGSIVMGATLILLN